MNYMRTAILLAVLTALFMGVGFVIGGQAGMIIAFIVALAMNVFSYWNSDKMVLRMHNAQLVDRNSAPEYVDLVSQLCENANMPMPACYIMHGDAAPEPAQDFGLFFGGNRNNSMGWIGTLAMVFLAPMAAGIVQMAISRTREYQADKLGAEICNRPLWLASALKKIAGATVQIPNMSAEHNPATAHMFIMNPLSGERMDNLFSTHPNPDNRIQRLIDLAGEWGQVEEEFSKPLHEGPWNFEDSDRGPWG